MSAIFCDSCSHYTTAQLPGKYDLIVTNAGVPNVSGLGARSGSGAIRLGLAAQCGVNVPSYVTYIVGHAISLPVGMSFGSNGVVPVVFRDASFSNNDSSIQTGIIIKPDGTVQAFKGNFSILGTTGSAVFPLTQGVNHYLEYKVTVSSTTGSVQVRLDQNPILTLTGLNNNNTATGVITQIILGDFPQVGSGAQETVCDIYMCDDKGPYNNDFLGDTGVYLLQMAGPGAITNWTAAGAAANWQAVSDNPSTDTKYVFDSTVNDRDLYAAGTIAATGNPRAVQLVARCEKDSPGARAIQLNIRSVAADVFSATVNLPVGFAFSRFMQEVDPNTGVQWASVSAITGAQYGQKLVT